MSTYQITFRNHPPRTVGPDYMASYLRGLLNHDQHRVSTALLQLDRTGAVDLGVVSVRVLPPVDPSLLQELSQ